MNNETNKAARLNSATMKIVHAIPIWGWTIILMVCSIFSHFFVSEEVVNSFSGFMTINGGTLFALVVIIGIVYALILRLLVRVTYGIAARIYFRNMVYVPDYNLRRLPIGYNDFCGLSLFLLCITNAFAAIVNILMYAVPVAMYLWIFIINIARLGVFVFGWFAIRAFAADWQSKGFFISLVIPAGILLALTMYGGF